MSEDAGKPGPAAAGSPPLGPAPAPVPAPAARIVLGTLGPIGEGASRARPAGEVRRLEAVSAALIRRVERMTGSQAGAYSLFQTAIHLESQVQDRTAELSRALERVEQTSRENLAAREAADRANRSKTRFLAAAGHDILQPLNAARLTLSTLRASGADEAARRRGLDTIAAALDTMEELIASVLDMARIDAGAVVPQAGPVELRRLLEAVAQAVAPLAARKGLALRVAGAPLWGWSDPALLKRIVANLASNAVRYTARGGVLLSARRRGAGVAVEVRDTGIGIPADQHALIFEEFHRGRAVGPEAGATAAGLGLGLSIVRRLAEALEHPLELRSIEGRGTAFRLRLPLCEAPALSAGPPRFSGGDGLAGAAVLCLGTAASAAGGRLEEAAALFARWRCRVAAEGGEPARPDLLLADAGATPETEAAALAAVARARAALGRPVPAILLWGAGGESPTGLEACERIGAPLRPAALRALAAHLLA